MPPPISAARPLAPCQGSKNCKDLLSLLGDDVLLLILSLLDQKEAARTSVLSKRWRHLWSVLPDYYDFDVSGTWWWRGMMDRQQHTDQLRKFVDYVNQVVSASRAPAIDRFRVHVPLVLSRRDDVHTWVDFAMGKRVKELELDLSNQAGICSGVPVSLDSFSRYAQYPSGHTLVSLSLVAVCINDCFLESALFNFPNLERLTLRCVHCQHSTFKVVGDLLKLRYLEISFCKDLRKLEISARNLISVIFNGHNEDVKFSYVPLLNEASFSGTYTTRLTHNFHYISAFSSQLTKLTIAMNQLQDIVCRAIEFPHFGNLKQLDLRFRDGIDKNLLFFTNFIDACPVLNKFKLQRALLQDADVYFPLLQNENTLVTYKVHSHLNTFEMVDFLGANVDIELVLYLAEFAIALEKVILYPFQPSPGWGILHRTTHDLVEATEKEAKQLQNQLPPRVQLELATVAHNI